MTDMKHVDEANFQTEVLESSEPVLVDFSAVWGQPCKMLDPVVKQLAGEWDGKVKVVKIDADENPNLVMTLALAGRSGEAAEVAARSFEIFEAKRDVAGAAQARERLAKLGIEVG